MLMTRVFWLSIAVSMTLIGNSQAADFDRGVELAAICASCHKLVAHDTDIPSIIGLDPAKFAALMQAFRKTERSNIIMYAVARSLSDQDVVSLGTYLSTLGKETKSP